MSDTGSGVGRIALALGCLAAVGFIAGPLLAFLGILPPLTGFSLFGLGGLLGVVTLVVSLLVWWRRGLSTASSGLVLGAVITVIFLLLAVPNRNLPRINDITTDTRQPPQFVKAQSLPGNEGRDMSYPGDSFAQQQAAGYPNLKAEPLAEAPAEAFNRVKQAAAQMPQWEITRTDADALALEGFSTSGLFHFKDDFVIEVRRADAGSVVQMRSKSRVGKGDVGANAARIEAFFAKLR